MQAAAGVIAYTLWPQSASFPPAFRPFVALVDVFRKTRFVVPDSSQLYRINSQSLAFIEGLYEDYLRDPASVDPDWRKYFDALSTNKKLHADGRIGPSFTPTSIFNPPTAFAGNGHAGVGTNGATNGHSANTALLQHRVDMLIRNYRVRAHRTAAVDPLHAPTEHPPELDPAFFGIGPEMFDMKFSIESGRGEPRPLREIVAVLMNTYCGSIGVQFMHIDDLNVRRWLQERMETTENRVRLTRAEQIRILTRLTDAVIFEEFIIKKFQGKKSFSLEGGESLIPLLDIAIEKAAEQSIEAVVMGMPHRGRLNVLANIMGKSPQQVFREFEDADPELHRGRGDVKYHLGYSSDWVAANGRKLHLSLTFNPSHLEFVNPVAMGRLRAKMDRGGDTTRRRGMCLLIHGDAAFAGEGVVQEVLNMSELPGYTVGGTLHVIVNNQVGFTTPPESARSSLYATDVAKLLQIPIFHVNGEDPEAVAQVVRLAMDFRQEFQRDVVIDMYCYRRRGHNEQDEPAYTQPLMYKAIRQRKSVREGYLEHLLKLGGVTREEADKIAEQRREHLDRELTVAKSDEFKYQPVMLTNTWLGYRGGLDAEVADVETGYPRAKLAELLNLSAQYPADFTPHPNLIRPGMGELMKRRAMAEGKEPLNWAAAESLAFGTLAVNGTRIRLTGQDAGRGTFSHRHAVLHDVETGRIFVPLQHLTTSQAPVEIIDSPLNETGVLGFEYGYSLEYPDGLVMWEAQFGDFANCAQVIIDQFIASAESKWFRLSAVTLLLPHGFEGQGPEHSSARLERFLQLCAEDNIQVVYPSSPAQYFHMLRRQVLRPIRKPLVVMTPKSLLRLPAAVSALDELATGRFQRVIGDARFPTAATAKGVKRVLLCTGKLYYELEKHREATKREDVAIARVEQLYPLPTEELKAALKPYAASTPVVWVQEEPENQGAWRFLRAHYGEKLLERFAFRGVSRPAAASPATGSHSAHEIEQDEVIHRAFED